MRKVDSIRVVLAGIGGDSHSVGLSLLRFGLAEAGYQVRYLGIQTPIDDLVKNAVGADYALVSNMDGHARVYLRDFTKARQKYRDGALWYLGGNISVGGRDRVEADFREAGFHRVFSKFSALEAVLDILEGDAFLLSPQTSYEPDWVATKAWSPDMWLAEEAGKIGSVSLGAARTEVLDQWKTGNSARNLEDNARVLASAKSFAAAHKSEASSLKSRPLVQPRSGVATLQSQAKLFRSLSNAGADVLSFQVDSLTRNNAYSSVEDVLKEGPTVADQVLNGFPMVNHGVAAIRSIVRSVQSPLQTRHSTRDPRLLAEVSMAGGVTGFEGGPICYNIPYYKDLPLSQSLRHWKYVDRLAGQYYDKFGLIIDREFFGTLTGTLIPPSLAIATNILEVLLAAEQGVRSVSVGYAEQGCRIQDLAAIETMRRLCSEWLDNAGHKNMLVNTVFHQYMAAFPPDEVSAQQLILASATTAGLSGASRVLVKTAVESTRIPLVQDNIDAIQTVKLGLESASRVRVSSTEIEVEATLIETEVNSILEAVFIRGRGTLEQGIIRGFQDGIIDVPFSPSVYNRGDVQTARGVDGAVRFVTFGGLPFDSDVKQFHRGEIDRRRSRDRRPDNENAAKLVEADVLCLPRGGFTGWPLSD